MGNESAQLADIISLQKPIVDGAIVKWLRGKDEEDLALLEEASVHFEHYKGIDNMARFFGGAVKIQLGNDNIEESLGELLEALELLIKNPNLSSGQFLKTCRNSLQLLVDVDEFFLDNYELPTTPTIGIVKQVLAETIKRNYDKRMLSELYAYITVYLNRGVTKVTPQPGL